MKSEDSQSQRSLQSFTSKDDYVKKMEEENARRKNRVSELKAKMSNIDTVLGSSRLVASSPVKGNGKSQNRGFYDSVQTDNRELQQLNLSQISNRHPKESATDFKTRVALEDQIKSMSEHVYKYKALLSNQEIVIEEQANRKDDLSELFDAKSTETKNTEEIIQKEQSDLKVKVEDIALMRKRDAHQTAQQKEKLKKKLATLEAALEKLTIDSEEANNSLEEIKLKAENNHAKRISTFKKCTRPLDDAQALVEEEKSKLESRIVEIEDAIQRSIEEREARINEIEELDGKKGQLIEEKTSLHAEMDVYKENYPDELKQFFMDMKYKQEIVDLLEKQKQLRKKVAFTERRKETRKLITAIFNQQQALAEKQTSLQNELNEHTKSDRIEIVRIEKYFEEKTTILGSDNLHDLIDKLATEDGFSIHNQILANQIIETEKQMYDTLMNQALKEEEITLKIRELQVQIRKMNPQVNQIKVKYESVKKKELEKGEKLTISKWRGRVKNLHSLLKEKRELQATMKQKQALLEDWKIESKAFLLENEAGMKSIGQFEDTRFDPLVVEQFLKKNLYKLGDMGSKKEFEDMLGFYVDRTSSREDHIQSANSELLATRAESQQVDVERKDLEEKLFDQDHEYHQAKQALKENLILVKARERLVEERNQELEFSITKQGEDQFDQYLTGNNDVFTSVKKTYGKKVSNKMEKDQREEFMEMVRFQFNKRREDMERIHEQILSVDKQLDDAEGLMETELPELIAKAQREKEEQEQLLASVLEQVEAFVTAENEIVNQIESLLERKKEQIVHETHEIYRDLNFENLQDRFRELKDQIETKQRQIERQEKIILEFEDAAFERTTQFQAEETQMKARIENLKLASNELSKNVKPQLQNLE